MVSICSYKTLLVVLFSVYQSSLQYDTGISGEWCRISRTEHGCECTTDGSSVYCANVELYYSPRELCTIKCNYNYKNWTVYASNWTDYVSGLKLGSLERLRIENCPLPNKPFPKLFEELGIKNVSGLRFKSNMDIGDAMKIEFVEGLSNITSIGLPNNKLTSLPRNIWLHFPRLKTLNLSNNKLKLELGTFPELKSLRSLQFASNSQGEIPPKLFSNITELTWLVLVKNKLHKLSQASFHSLSKLEQFDISDNLLTELPDGVFAELRSLAEIRMNLNNFSRIQGDTFRFNKNIRQIEISFNKQKMTIGNGLYAGLTKLKSVKMEHSRIEEIPPDMLNGTVNLTYLSLAINHLRTLPENLFHDTTNLEKLSLASNNLTILPDRLFAGLTALKQLDLRRNNITSLSDTIFRDMTKLMSLNMDHNNLKTISIATFSRTYELTTVSMQFNDLQFSSSPRDAIGCESPFHASMKIEKLLLSHNFIDEICADWKYVFSKLVLLDLSYNNVTGLYFDDLNFLGGKTVNTTIDLRNNQVTRIDLGAYPIRAAAEEGENTFHPYVTIKIDNNPLNCDCTAYQLIRFLQKEDMFFNTQFEANNLTCAAPNSLKGQVAQTLPLASLTCSVPGLVICPTECPPNCNCQYRPVDQAFIVNCSGPVSSSVDDNFPPVINPTTCRKTNHTELILSHRNLVEWPSVLPSGYDRVTYLDLSYNNLSVLNPSALPKSLTTLHLHHNNFSYVDNTLLQFIENIITNNTKHGIVTLSNNPWVCNCKAINFLTFLQKKYKTFADDSENIRCEGSDKVLIKMTTDALCPSRVALIVGLSIACVILATCFAIIAALYYKHQQKIKVWLYAHRICLWFVTEEEIDKDKVYDAFISYSHKDEEFVSHELVPGLEQGEPPFKLCLHHRDWIAGDWIPNQIARSVEQSRRTVVVLSPAFLESVWGRLEFRAAHRQALSEKRARVIIVLYGDVGDTEKLDPELKAYLTMNTYVQWGEPWFWRKLRYALPHPPQLRGKLHKRAFEDKLELITASTLAVSRDSIKTNGTVQVEVVSS